MRRRSLKLRALWWAITFALPVCDATAGTRPQMPLPPVSKFQSPRAKMMGLLPPWWLVGKPAALYDVLQTRETNEKLENAHRLPLTDALLVYEVDELSLHKHIKNKHDRIATLDMLNAVARNYDKTMDIIETDLYVAVLVSKKVAIRIQKCIIGIDNNSIKLYKGSGYNHLTPQYDHGLRHFHCLDAVRLNLVEVPVSSSSEEGYMYYVPNRHSKKGFMFNMRNKDKAESKSRRRRRGDGRATTARSSTEQLTYTSEGESFEIAQGTAQSSRTNRHGTTALYEYVADDGRMQFRIAMTTTHLRAPDEYRTESSWRGKLYAVPFNGVYRCAAKHTLFYTKRHSDVGHAPAVSTHLWSLVQRQWTAKHLPSQSKSQNTNGCTHNSSAVHFHVRRDPPSEYLRYLHLELGNDALTGLIITLEHAGRSMSEDLVTIKDDSKVVLVITKYGVFRIQSSDTCNACVELRTAGKRRHRQRLYAAHVPLHPLAPKANDTAAPNVTRKLIMYYMPNPDTHPHTGALFEYQEGGEYHTAATRPHVVGSLLFADFYRPHPAPLINHEHHSAHKLPPAVQCAAEAQWGTPQPLLVYTRLT